MDQREHKLMTGQGFMLHSKLAITRTDLPGDLVKSPSPFRGASATDHQVDNRSD